MEALIVSKTRMKNAICVGALLLDYDANIRLLNPGNKNQPTNTDFEIGEVWDLRFIKRNPIHEPHTEDRIVLKKSHLRSIPNLSDFLETRDVNIAVGDPENLFDGSLEWHKNGSGYIPDNGVMPDHSVCFWKADKDLTLYQNFGKSRYRYSKEISFPYVGLVEPTDTIPAGTIIRLSITRPFGEANSCWLQLSGWY